jgi:hypothetical protein
MRSLAAALSALLLLLAACVPAADEWTDEVRDNFLEACEESSGGELAYCRCVLDDLEATYTLAEFEEIERQLDETGEMPAELEAIIDACIEEHIT